ncbi:hypothetical protein T01_1638 [Trichinella spiralis]|uniref:Uncharacterized protein n=1 Tax=Trichinella spiralis TaxID=6334 RepID=A0A0V1BTE7_TRISP|nr:hypothetical protein T01_1638 [Trichinella spiralis]
MTITFRAHLLRLYEIFEPGWSPRLSPLPLSPLGSFSLTSVVVRLESVEVYHQPFPSTSHLLHPVRFPIQLPLDLVRTVRVRPKFGLCGEVLPHLIARVVDRSVGFPVFPSLLASLFLAGFLSDHLVHPLQISAQVLHVFSCGPHLCIRRHSVHQVHWQPELSAEQNATGSGYGCASDKPAVPGRGRHPNLPDGRWTPSLACPAACGSSVLPSRLTAGGKRWPGFSSRQTAGTPPSPAPTRRSGLGRSAVSPAHRSGRKRRSLEPLPPCAPQRWAGGTPPATWRSSRTPLGCSDYHSESPPRVPQGP